MDVVSDIKKQGYRKLRYPYIRNRFYIFFHLSFSVNTDGYRDDIPVKLNLKYGPR